MTAEVPSDPAASLKRLAAGRAQFADLLRARGAARPRRSGVPVVAVGALVTRPLNSVIVRTDRGITTPKDLEGKTVGVAGVPSDRPLLDAVVRSDGGDPSKVTVRNVGFNLSPALAAGKVDAVIGAYWNIELVDLERQGVPVAALRLEENGVPDYDELVVVTSDEVARDQPELVRAFLRGLRTGQDWAATDQAGAVAAPGSTANQDLDPETVEAAARGDGGGAVAVRRADPAASIPAEWAQFIEWMRDNELLTEPVDVDAVVTDRFLPEER